jgi:molybdopterin/thiamine biosynthesis adenylyltransferase
MSTDRYERHTQIAWFDQDLVRSQRVVVVGAGAVGNEVVKNLALLGTGEIHIFDQDVIEIHNLTRSVLFRDDDLGKPKAECAANRARELDSAVLAVPYVGDFWATLRFSLLQAATGVFCCVDNFEARVRLNRLCAIAGTPLINVGIDCRFAVVDHFPFAAAKPGPCYECGLPLSVYSIMGKRYSCGSLRRLAVVERKIPTTILTSSAAGGLAVSRFLRGVADGAPESSTRYFQDTFTGHTTCTDLVAREGCPGCSDLTDQRIVVQARRALGTIASDIPADIGEMRIVTSERVLTGIRCTRCEANEPGLAMLQSADRYDETLALCPRCEDRTREIRWRDDFSVQELQRDYAGFLMPGKFVMCRHEGLNIVIELEGTEHVARDSDSEDSRPHAEGRSDSGAREPSR